MSTDSLRSRLIASSDSIYHKYYSSIIPITKIGGGIGHEVDLAIELTSKMNRATLQDCNLYFSINSTILSYLQGNREISTAYAKSPPRYLGSTFSIEQLLADEITRGVFLVIVGAITTKLIDKTPMFKKKLVNKLSSILNRKTKNNLELDKIKKHAEGIAIDIINSPNAKISISKIHSQKKVLYSRQTTKRKKRKTTSGKNTGIL